jgi:hypothetical protein
MKKFVCLSLLLVTLTNHCMEQSSDADTETDKKNTLALMIAMVVPEHERTFIQIDTLDTSKVTDEQIDALKTIVLRDEYQPLLKYAFDKKKILPTDELASSMLVEAASHETSNLMFLLECGVNANKTGRLLAQRNHDEKKYTPLLIAIKNICSQHVKNLFKKGADANICETHENLPRIEAFLLYHKFRSKYKNACIKNPGADKEFYFCAIMHYLDQAGADVKKDNAKDILVNHYDTGNHTFVSRNLRDIKCRLGYEGL